jgi:hypothetical protein
MFQDVIGGAAFHVLGYNINPGIKDLFPWLSGIAGRFQEYRINRMKVEFQTRTATTQGGIVVLAPDYSVSDAPPSIEQDMMAYQDAVSSTVWRDVHCKLDPKALMSTGARKFVRAQVTSGDSHLYDAGKFYIGHETTYLGTVGKLWVDYDISLFTPQLNSTAEPVVSAKVACIGLDPNFPFGVTGGTRANIVGDIDYNSVDLVDVDQKSIYTLQPGLYKVEAALCTSTTLGDQDYDIGLNIGGVDHAVKFAVNLPTSAAPSSSLTTIAHWLLHLLEPTDIAYWVDNKAVTDLIVGASELLFTLL